MKRCLSILAILSLLTWSLPVFAAPLLQLDIGGGIYYTGDDPRYDNETIISSGKNPDKFTLYALMQQKKGKTSLIDDYYISMALYPSNPLMAPSADFGSFTFTFAGKSIVVDVVNDMAYGNPGIPSHGIFDTYFFSYKFKFDDDNHVAVYNAQDNPGAYFSAGTGLYYAAFSMDTSSLSDAYSIHFDIYKDNKTFAPFSHDAQSDPPKSVSEPTTSLLVALGLIGVVGVKRRLKK